MSCLDSFDINTTQGPMHIYICCIPPIPDSGMIKNRNIMIVETNSKRYCNFLGEKFYEYKNYEFKFKYGTFHLYRGSSHKETEQVLVSHPALRTNPFSVVTNNMYEIPMMIIDYVSCPGTVYDNKNKTSAQGLAQTIDMESYKKIIVEFKIILYEYENIDEELKIDTENVKNVIENTNLVKTLKKILLIEQGKVFLDKSLTESDQLNLLTKKRDSDENTNFAQKNMSIELYLQKQYDELLIKNDRLNTLNESLNKKIQMLESQLNEFL